MSGRDWCLLTIGAIEALAFASFVFFVWRVYQEDRRDGV